jgi:hypothetical protein
MAPLLELPAPLELLEPVLDPIQGIHGGAPVEPVAEDWPSDSDPQAASARSGARSSVRMSGYAIRV